MAEQVRRVFSNHPVAASAGAGAVLVAAPALVATFGAHAGIQFPQNPHHHLQSTC